MTFRIFGSITLTAYYRVIAYPGGSTSHALANLVAKLQCTPLISDAISGILISKREGCDGCSVSTADEIHKMQFGRAIDRGEFCTRSI